MRPIGGKLVVQAGTSDMCVVASKIVIDPTHFCEKMISLG